MEEVSNSTKQLEEFRGQYSDDIIMYLIGMGVELGMVQGLKGLGSVPFAAMAMTLTRIVAQGKDKDETPVKLILP